MATERKLPIAADLYWFSCVKSEVDLKSNQDYLFVVRNIYTNGLFTPIVCTRKKVGNRLGFELDDS